MKRSISGLVSVSALSSGGLTSDAGAQAEGAVAAAAPEPAVFQAQSSQLGQPGPAAADESKTDDWLHRYAPMRNLWEAGIFIGPLFISDNDSFRGPTVINPGRAPTIMPVSNSIRAPRSACVAAIIPSAFWGGVAPTGGPIRDADSDGVPDHDDQSISEKGEAPTGCPDTDHDGFLDRADQCPDVPGVAPNGCLADADGDGIVGADDQCPDQPETLNGFEDTNGCPGELPAAVKEFMGVIAGIEFDSNQAVLRPSPALWPSRKLSACSPNIRPCASRSREIPTIAARASATWSSLDSAQRPSSSAWWRRASTRAASNQRVKAPTCPSRRTLPLQGDRRTVASSSECFSRQLEAALMDANRLKVT
jgi:hypothetical protein